jgi:hypothetical protein
MIQKDRASVIAAAAIQIFERSVIAWFRGGTLSGLRTALTEYLRDEIADIERHVASDIRPQDG